MWTSLKTEDPVVFLIPKHRFRQQIEVPAGGVEAVVGSAKGAVRGDDVTIVTWGNCIEQAFEAAEILADPSKSGLDEAVSCEIIDLRTLVPWDFETVAQSLSKTGRLVVIEEDSRTCSFGQTIIQELTSNPETWGYFFSPPQLVSKYDVHIGFNPIYEYAALPDMERVVEAVKVVMKE